MERSKSRTLVSLTTATALAVTALTPAFAQTGATNGEWPAYGGDGGGIR